jgi:hypothetical protein
VRNLAKTWAHDLKGTWYSRGCALSCCWGSRLVAIQLKAASFSSLSILDACRNGKPPRFQRAVREPQQRVEIALTALAVPRCCGWSERSCRIREPPWTSGPRDKFEHPSSRASNQGEHDNETISTAARRSLPEKLIALPSRQAHGGPTLDHLTVAKESTHNNRETQSLPAISAARLGTRSKPTPAFAVSHLYTHELAGTKDVASAIWLRRRRRD